MSMEGYSAPPPLQLRIRPSQFCKIKAPTVGNPSAPPPPPPPPPRACSCTDMALHSPASLSKSLSLGTEFCFIPLYSSSPSFRNELRVGMARPIHSLRVGGRVGVYALDRSKSSSSSSSDAKKGVPNSNYVVPLDMSSSCITRPLVEILRDLNKRIPDAIVKHDDSLPIPWYHANRMLSFYAPGWCGEIRDVIFSDNGSVTVVYRVTVRGSDGEAHRESTGTVLPTDGHGDPVAAAEEIAFCRACARFGLGLYLYHEE